MLFQEVSIPTPPPPPPTCKATGNSEGECQSSHHQAISPPTNSPPSQVTSAHGLKNKEYTSFGGELVGGEVTGYRGSQNTKFLKESMKLNWNFQRRGEGVQTKKKLPWGRYGYFPDSRTQYTLKQLHDWLYAVAYLKRCFAQTMQCIGSEGVFLMVQPGNVF